MKLHIIFISFTSGVSPYIRKGLAVPSAIEQALAVLGFVFCRVKNVNANPKAFKHFFTRRIPVAPNFTHQYAQQLCQKSPGSLAIWAYPSWLL